MPVFKSKYAAYLLLITPNQYTCPCPTSKNLIKRKTTHRIKNLWMQKIENMFLILFQSMSRQSYTNILGFYIMNQNRIMNISLFQINNSEILSAIPQSRKLKNYTTDTGLVGQATYFFSRKAGKKVPAATFCFMRVVPWNRIINFRQPRNI